ncbi:MAG: C25 family cysteine peptidase, partial [Gammaproteobacteria bacterium]|nr:C25 family cysteine peptidase [Gammaproteobacteria bacterium]
FWAIVDASNAATELNVELPDARADQPARLSLDFKQFSLTPAHALVWVNGAAAGEVQWDGTTSRSVSFDLPAGSVQPGTNQVSIQGLLDPGVSYSFFNLDALRFEYAREYHAVNDELVASAGGADEIVISGFSGAEISVFDISDPRRPAYLDNAASSDDGGFSVRFAAEDGHRYLALGQAAVLFPAVEAISEPDLRDKNLAARYVLITPAALRSGAQRLADYRGSQGMSSLVVDLESIYNQFNDGLPDPRAIREFLAYAAANWAEAPTHVGLVGKGTHDYKDIYGAGDNLLPPWIVRTPDGIYAADNRFADLVGDDGVPEMAVGRLPVTDLAELDAVIDKIIAFEAGKGDWTGKALLVADNADKAGSFEGDTLDVASHLPAGLSGDTLFLSSYGNVAGARNVLFDRLNQPGEGRRYVNYLGHGGVTLWATEGLLTTDDIADPVRIANAGRTPVVASMTCVVNLFETPGYQSLGEAMLLQPLTGAVASWGPSGPSLNSHAVTLNKAFLDAMDSNDTLGGAVRGALAAYAATPDSKAYIRDIYNLLTDPALRMGLNQE